MTPSLQDAMHSRFNTIPIVMGGWKDNDIYTRVAETENAREEKLIVML